ncbi:MAG: hypothetical protein LBG84_06605 [Treponema sp.]|jgi:hypothetical protein|nr:hypothetical protein [Treponema sp.]
MKKLVCLWFIALSAAAVFAQELKFSGYVNSGMGLVITGKENSDPAVMTYGVDSERNIGRFRLNGTYTNAGGTGGADFRLQVQGRGVSSLPENIPSLAFAYGWFKPAKFLTIKAGLVDDSAFTTGDVILNDDQGEGAGLLVKLSPLRGLDLGAGAYAASYQGGGSNNLFDGQLPQELRWDRIKYTFGLAYTLEDAFRVTLSGRTWNKAGSNETSARAIGEFRLLAVKNLTAVVAVEGNNLYEDHKDFRDHGLITFYETLGYQWGDWGFGLNAAQYKSNETGREDLALLVNPWVSRALAGGTIVPRLEAVYFLGGNQDGANYHRRAYKANYHKDAYVITGRPSVKISLDPRVSLEIGDAVYYQRPVQGDGALTNVFYADLVVKF